MTQIRFGKDFGGATVENTPYTPNKKGIVEANGAHVEKLVELGGEIVGDDAPAESAPDTSVADLLKGQ